MADLDSVEQNERLKRIAVYLKVDLYTTPKHTKSPWAGVRK